MMTNFLDGAATALCLWCKRSERRDPCDGYCRGCREEADREAERELGGVAAVVARREVQEWFDDPGADPRAFVLVDEEWIRRERVTINVAESKPQRPKRLSAVPALRPQIGDWISDALAAVPAIVTADEAMSVLRMSRRNFYRLTSRGVIRAHRAREAGSSRLLIPRSELERYLRGLMP
jgi:excisionase family DNA binding protein